MNVKELKEIVDTNSNDKVNKALDKLYSIIAKRAKNGNNSYTTTRQKLGLNESELLRVIERLLKDGYAVYKSDSLIRYEDVADDEGFDCFCTYIAVGILKLQGFRTTQIKIVWKFEED